VAAQFGLTDRAALVHTATRETVGLPYESLRQVARRADVLVNISGMLANADLIDRIPVRVYLDLDPAFIQMWHAVEGIDMRFAAHTHFVTIGQAIGQPGCAVPTCGRQWIATPQPMVLEHWPLAGPVEHDALTTIGNWRGYGSIEHQGVFYGQKAHSLRPLMDLPTRTTMKFLLAMAIHAGEQRDLAALAANGWALTDPARVAGTPDAYQRFIQGSWGELGIAKSGYVASRCGWFSDRSICYLAFRPPGTRSGNWLQRLPAHGRRPAALRNGPGRAGGVQQLRADYPRHARAARVIAQECFDSDKVLGQLLGKLGVS